MKCIDLTRHARVREEAKKEALIHRRVTVKGNHRNIVRYIGTKEDPNASQFFILLEYIDGGELFDQIEPEVGVSSLCRAQFYFKQLADGVAFIHGLDIAHRDLKPENLFLTKNDVLKIGDFGLATIFRHNGVERRLHSKCGTRPYASPEVLQGSYYARQTDIWSCGIILVALLTGELPWAVPSEESSSFERWMNGKASYAAERPWSRIDPIPLSLLRKLLAKDESARPMADAVAVHPWLTSPVLPHEELPTKRLRICDESISQPLAVRRVQQMSTPTSDSSAAEYDDDAVKNPFSEEERPSFSQPVGMADLLLTQSQHETGVISGLNTLARLARRMTRFCVKTTIAATLRRVRQVCRDAAMDVLQKTPTQLVCTLRDVTFVVNVYMMCINDTKMVMVDFRRSRGDGLEFKRLFRRVQPSFADIECTQGTQWLFSHGLTHSQLP